MNVVETLTKEAKKGLLKIKKNPLGLNLDLNLVDETEAENTQIELLLQQSSQQKSLDKLLGNFSINPEDLIKLKQTQSLFTGYQAGIGKEMNELRREEMSGNVPSDNGSTAETNIPDVKKGGVGDIGKDATPTEVPGSEPTKFDEKSVPNPSDVLPDSEDSKSFGEKFSSSTFGKNFGAWSAGLDAANNIAEGITGPKGEYSGPKGNITKSMDAAYDTILNIAGKLGPTGLIVSLAMGANKLVGGVVNKLGGGTDGMTTTDAILGSAFMQMTPLGLINGFGGKKADTITKDDEAFESVGSSYGGTNATVDDALLKSGKKYGAFSGGARKKANYEIAEAKRLQDIMANIADYTNDKFNIRTGMSTINGNRRAFNLQGGYDQGSIHAARHGMRLEKIKNPILTILEELIPTLIEEEIIPDIFEYDDISKFEKGGKFNILPEGALHARLHHLDIDGITKKGIPVISEDGGKIEQHAEIEHSEIILRLSVTEKLELLKKLFEDESKDEYAIEAGKLLVKEILYNTDDRVNLINNE